MPRKKKLNYNVIFDANILRRNLSDIQNLFDKYGRRRDCVINYILPEVVRQEFRKLFTEMIRSDVDTHSKSSTRLRKYLKLKLLKAEVPQSKIDEGYQQLLKSLHVQILKIPAKVNHKKLVEDVVWSGLHGEGKSGYRDILIAVTIQENISKLTRGAELVFLCDDRRFSEFLEKYFGGKMPIINSVSKFESGIKADLADLEEVFIKEITEEAGRIFIPLFTEYKIQEKIEAQYKNLFRSPRISELSMSSDLYLPRGDWEPIENGRYFPSETLFNSKSGKNVFTFETEVLFKQPFRRRVIDTYAIVLPSEKLYVLEFSIFWQVAVDKRGKFEDTKLKEIKLKNEYVQDIYSAKPSPSEAPLSGATTSSGLELDPVDLSSYVLCPSCGASNPESLYLCRECGGILAPKTNEWGSLK